MYNFIDVAEMASEVVLPSEALQINGEYIENQISGYRTLSVSGREALSAELSTYETRVRAGSMLKSKRYPARTITVQYQLIAATNEAFREAYNALGRILNVQNAELIFADEQDKFFIGTPGNIGAVEPGRNSVVGEFDILCVDPFKYSIAEYEAEPSTEDSTILIDYGGTYKAFPTLEADFYNEVSEDGDTTAELTGNGDCGFVAFFNENEKIIQLGDPDEADEEEAYEKSQTLFNSAFKKSTDWGTAAKSQWAVNSGVTSSSAVEQAGTPAMGVASYTDAETPASTSGTLLTATSKASSPYVEYTVTAKTSNRTANSVKVAIAIKAALTESTSYWKNEGVLVTSVYIGGSWHNVTMKAASDKWESTSGHTKNITVTVTGLSASTTSMTGIKFKATRSDSLGSAGVLGETACKNLSVSAYTEATPETYYLTASDFGSGSQWHGPSVTRTVPADASGEVGAKNFTLTYSQKMSIGNSSDAVNQLGAFQVMLHTGSGSDSKIIAGANVYKCSSGKNARLRFYINNTVVETMDIDLSYGNKYFRPENSSTITKHGATVNFNICGIKKSYSDLLIEDMAVAKVTFTITQYGTNAALSYNGLYNAKFVKNNCETWRDIPNKFSAGDVVTADCRNGEICLNGIPAPYLGALGNDWEGFCLVPGLNQIGVAFSDFVSAGYAPSFKVRYREVFL